MLRKQAQLRIKAYRKKLWAERRLAKEIALGRPLRRVRANLSRAAWEMTCGHVPRIMKKT